MPIRRQGNRRSEHKFSEIPRATIPRSQFNRSHTHKTTFDAGLLVPIMVDEVLPGDTWNLNLTLFARLATPIYPIMDNMYLDVFFFFIPYRLVWDNWQKFCGEQDDPADSIAFTIPTITAHASSGFGLDSVFDYMGIPPKIDSIVVSALPLRSYALTWNQWFRDQNLQDSVTVDKDDGPDLWSDYATLLSRGKRHDYFTSCLPWPQKQTAAVTLPIGDTAPVIRNSATAWPGWEVTGTGPAQFQGYPNTPGGGTDEVTLNATFPGGASIVAGKALWGTDVGLKADLSSATASTINAIREAFQIQKLLERDARGGTRYVELVKSHFGVTSPDARLQRVEYLGGGSVPIIISAVAQTSQKTAASSWDTTEKGSLAAFGTAAGGGIGFNKSFVEHGTILALVSARADLTYQQGLHKMWSRSTRYDFYWPAFANLGEQAVLNQEIWIQDPTGAPGITENVAVFGYQERWAEYRYSPSYVSGLFRSDTASNIDEWHLAQDFATLPTLGNTFIKDTPPVDRVIAVQTEPHFIFDSYFQIKCARPMPVYSIPGLIDHF